jgi:hypothetical protein
MLQSLRECSRTLTPLSVRFPAQRRAPVHTSKCCEVTVGELPGLCSVGGIRVDGSPLHRCACADAAADVVWSALFLSPAGQPGQTGGQGGTRTRYECKSNTSGHVAGGWRARARVSSVAVTHALIRALALARPSADPAQQQQQTSGGPAAVPAPEKRSRSRDGVGAQPCSNGAHCGQPQAAAAAG